MPRFDPPTADATPPILPRPHPGNDLFKHFKSRAMGLSVLKLDGVWQTIQSPTLDQTNAADYYFAGGHTAIISAALAAELTAAGYGANIS